MKKLLIIGTAIILAVIVFSNADFGNKNTSPNNSAKPADISNRKKELGLDYQITLDRTPKMTRDGRNFQAVIVPVTSEPTIAQLKTLGEIIRDEYAAEPFLWIEIYNDLEVAETDRFDFDLNNDDEWEIVENMQSHMIVQYNKNDASGLNEFKIYPEGFGVTKYEDVITINY